MKYLKKFNESVDFESSLRDLRIWIYKSNDDGSIDVDDNLDMSTMSLVNLTGDRLGYGKFPLPKFNKIGGDFVCSTNYLTDLSGSPEFVGGEFECYNNCLKSLKGGPIEVGSNIDCNQNEITSLEGSPSISNGYFNCSRNSLTNLKGSPKNINGAFICNTNKLTSLEGCPDIINDLICFNNELYDFYGIGNVGGEVICKGNPVFEIYRLCPTNEFIKYLNEFRPIRGKTILGKRLQECLYMCDVTDIDVTNISFGYYTLLE